MWFPSFVETFSFTRRGHLLFALVIAIFIGVVIGMTQGPSPKAAAFDVRPIDAGMLAPVDRTSIIGTDIPLPTQAPADAGAVSAEAVAQVHAPREILATTADVRDVNGAVVARTDAFAPAPSSPPALRMAAAYAGVSSADGFGAPAPEQWPGFASLDGGGGGGGGTMIAGAESPLLIGDTETAKATPPADPIGDARVTKIKPAVENDPSDTTESQIQDPPAPAAAQPVPEPSSFFLMAFALLSLGAMSRRKLRRA